MEKLTVKDILHYHLVFRNVFKDMLRPDKTPISEFEILMVINEREGIKVGELSNIMSITRPNLTPLVDALEQKGFITRKQDEEDKRVTRLFITEAGKTQAEENYKIIEERCSELKKKYTEQELKKTKDYCDKLVEILSK